MHPLTAPATVPDCKPRFLVCVHHSTVSALGAATSPIRHSVSSPVASTPAELGLRKGLE